MDEIVAIRRSDGVALDSAGITHSVATWIDRFGHKTLDGSDAAAAVVALASGRFAAVDLSQFESVSTQ